jgi:PHD/YefM family antitoxin component YafN of YafNO toxin-antitoxin module
MIQAPLDEADHRLDQLRERLVNGDASQTVALTENGKPVLAVIPWSLYEALLDAAQVPTDPHALLVAPPHVRDQALAIAAARAEQEYRMNPELTDFEAFGDSDLFDATE